MQQPQLAVNGISLLSHPTSIIGWQGVACIVVAYQLLTIALLTAPKNMGTRLLSEMARKLTNYFSKAL